MKKINDLSNAPDPIRPTRGGYYLPSPKKPNYKLRLMDKRWEPYDAACYLCGVHPKGNYIPREKKELISDLYPLCLDLFKDDKDSPSSYITMAITAMIELPPKLAQNKEIKNEPFPCPPGTTWEDEKITFVDE